MLLSFMSESRRLSNDRMKRELRARLRYPTPQAMLDEAGYPKAPPSRRAQPLRPPPAPAAPRADAPTTIAPTTGGGYPKP